MSSLQGDDVPGQDVGDEVSVQHSVEEFDASKAPSMATSTVLQHSPLLRLPRELRDKIYEEVLPVDRRAPVTPYRCCDADSSTAASWKPVIMLLQTCRQILAEVAPLFYGNAAFFLRTTESTAQWLQSLGPRKRDIRYVHLDGFVEYSSSPTAVEDVVEQLRELVSLRSLQLCYPEWASPLPAAYLAHRLLPLFEALVAQRCPGQSASEVTDIMLVVPPRSASHGSYGTLQAHCSILTNYIRHFLHRMLGLGDD